MAEAKFEEILKKVCYHPGPNAAYPFYLVQLSAEKELDLDGALVSDALAWLLSQHEYSHVFIQTHGWNTPPDKAIKIPFSQFMAGMQDDPNMPRDATFKPLFVAFTWQALPLKFMLEQDALTRTELLGDALKECQMEDHELTEAAQAVSSVARGGPPDELRSPMKKLGDTGRLGIDENEAADTNSDAIVDRAISESAAEEPGADAAAAADRGTMPGAGLVQKLLDPVQRLIFGRLIERGVRTGDVLQDIMAKLMRARRAKYCLMANSLGAHVLAGALLTRGELPFRAHTVFMVQGACNRDWFGPRGRYKTMHQQVAGPIVCTLSEKDTMLSRIFEPFHGDAVGTFGFVTGARMGMHPKSQAASRPYEWKCGDWNSVDGSQFIDEGNPVVGGHGDFKEDETTMTYWSAVNVNVPDEQYDFQGTADEGKPLGFLGKIMGVLPFGSLF